jgi:hypothetical protein
MRIAAIAVVFLLLSGCSDATEIMPIPEAGANYYTAREKLISAGWQPTPAKCSERNICFSEAPELAANLDSASTCSTFVRGTSSIRVCGQAVPDGMLVKSAQAGP